MTTLHPALIDIAAGARAAHVADPEALLRSAAEHSMSGLLWSRVGAGEPQLPRAVALELASHATLIRIATWS